MNEEAEVSTTKPTEALTPEEIEAEIAATRARLASTVDELVDKAHPRNIAKRQVERVRSQIFDENGSLRAQKVGSVAGAIAGVLVLLLLVRRLVNRR